MTTEIHDNFPVILPHGEGFRLLSRVTVVRDDGYVEGEYDYSGEAVLHHSDHFPGKVRMPGCDIIEGMAETAIQVTHTIPEYENCIFFLTGIKDAEFVRPVSPCTLTYTADIHIDESDPRTGFAICNAEIREPDPGSEGDVKVTKVASAILLFKIARKPKKKE